MKFEWFIARRYLTRGRKNSFISIISLASIVGITIGVAALIIALSLINGFQKDIRDRILSSSAHLMVTASGNEGIDDYRGLIKQISERFPQVRLVTPVVYGMVLVRGSAQDVSGAVFRGIDLSQPQKETWLNKLELGRLPAAADQILIGTELALKLGLIVGDNCLVITPQPVLSPSGLIPKYRRFRISGIFKSGLFEFDSGTVIAGLGSAQALFNFPGRIHYLQINLFDLFAAEPIAADLRRMLPGQYGVVTWKELNASLYSALALEKTVLFFTLTLIIVVASLNIIAGLILLVIQKIKDIGILLSYGAGPGLIKKIFFIQGGVIGLIGTAFGVMLGVSFCALANRFELIKIPADIYQVNHVTFHVNPLDLLAIILASLLISFTATLIPSRRAASINVVDAVKYE